MSDDDAAIVVERHLRAVAGRDTAAMAADYAPDAVIERGSDVHRGRVAITAYFATVPARLGSGRVVVDETTIRDDVAVFAWHVEGGPADGARGRDTCTVRDGRIVHQSVELGTADF